MPPVIEISASGDSLEVGSRQIARESGGRLWVVYRDGPEVWSSFSDNDGLTWTPELVDDTLTSGSQPACCVDGNDILHVVWSAIGANGSYPTYRHIAAKQRNSWGVWSAIDCPSFDVSWATNCSEPCVAARSSDVYCVFTASGGATKQIRVSRTYSGSWVSSGYFVIGTSVPSSPSLAVDASGIARVSFNATGGAPSFYQYIRYGYAVWDAVSGWTTPSYVISAQEMYVGSSIGVDPNTGDIHVVMSRDSFNQLQFYDVGTFTTTALETGVVSNPRASIGYATDGSIYVAYNYNGNVVYKQWTSRGGWGARQTISSPGGTPGPFSLLYAIHPRELEGGGSLDYVYTNIPATGFAVVWEESVKFYNSGMSFPPSVSDITPNWGYRDETLSVQIDGTNMTGATSVEFEDGITVNSFTVVSGTQIDASITIHPFAELKTYDVSVTTPAGTGTLTDGFLVRTYGRWMLANGRSGSDRTEILLKLSSVSQSIRNTSAANIALPAFSDGGELTVASFLLSLGSIEEVIKLTGWVNSLDEKDELETAILSWYDGTDATTLLGSNLHELHEDWQNVYYGLVGSCVWSKEGGTAERHEYTLDFLVKYKIHG